MSTKYKLACPKCPTVHQVALAQAGDAVRCQCGSLIPVPTLRQLRQCEPVEESTASAGPAEWDVRRGLIFVGGLVLVAFASLVTWRILPQRQALDVRRPAFREINFDVQQLTPVQAWEAWEHLREQKLDYRTTPEYLENRSQYWELSMYLYGAWVTAGIGLLLVAAALLWPRRRRA